jgi:hypothetical protein
MFREDSPAVDRDSLEALVRTHQAEVYTYIHYLGAPRDVAEDLAQETFLVAFRKSLPPDVLDASGQKAWLSRGGLARRIPPGRQRPRLHRGAQEMSGETPRGAPPCPRPPL